MSVVISSVFVVFPSVSVVILIAELTCLVLGISMDPTTNVITITDASIRVTPTKNI